MIRKNSKNHRCNFKIMAYVAGMRKFSIVHAFSHAFVANVRSFHISIFRPISHRLPSAPSLLSRLCIIILVLDPSTPHGNQISGQYCKCLGNYGRRGCQSPGLRLYFLLVGKRRSAHRDDQYKNRYGLRFI